VFETLDVDDIVIVVAFDISNSFNVYEMILMVVLGNLKFPFLSNLFGYCFILFPWRGVPCYWLSHKK